MALSKGEYETKLEEFGCIRLGGGLYSKVYALPNDPYRVIKVGECDPWPDYIKWANENGHAGKFAPKVYSLKFYRCGERSYYAALMERLVCTMSDLAANGKRTDQHRAWQAMWDRAEDDFALDFKAFIKEAARNGFSGDLHGGNGMLRSDGSIVVTDPVAGSGSSSFRLKHGSISASRCLYALT